MKFIYSNDLTKYADIMKTKIEELECKHLLNEFDCPLIYKLAVQAGYPGCIWGYIIGGTTPTAEKETIEHMRCDRNFHIAMRIVKTSDGLYWADNTHTAITYILRQRLTNVNPCICSVPFYIIDFSADIPVIAGNVENIRDSIESIQGAILAGEQIENRVKKGVREHKKENSMWTIKRLMSFLY